MSVRTTVRLLACLVLAATCSAAPFASAQQPPPATPSFRGPLDEEAGTTAGPPPGIEALPLDMFNTTNFYKDRALWTDKRYFHCMSPRQLMESYLRYGANPGYPKTAPWGDCSIDFPRDQIVSPYPYKTAKEHYDALMAAAKAKGGPTVYTKATTPDWDGYYTRATPVDGRGQWIWGTANQYPTFLSLLTPAYQTRTIQANYHEAITNAPQWTASFCYPEGFMRWWSVAGQGGNFQLSMNPSQVTFVSGIAATFLRQVMIGQTHIQKVPQWYGETVGFWDGTTLISWTANVQGWIKHSMFEFSNEMQTVETYKPALDANGQFIGLDHEVVFYDPIAFAEPLRLIHRFNRLAPLNAPDRRFSFVECLSNIRNVEGRAKQLTRGDPNYVDYYGRPWAQNWDQWFEKGWEKPDSEVVDADILDLFK